MDKSGEKDGNARVIEIDQTPRRNVRRKLVQSTLAPHKSDEVIESNGDRMCDVGNKEECEGGDGDFCTLQGKKKRRKQKETTPKNGASKKLAKGKSPRKLTPKKSATKNGIVAASDHMIAANVSPPVPNLRLEAKLRAEEDSRMSAGKQLHPFFSSWKGGKKNQEAAATENGTCQGQGRDQIVTIGPIHVFEKFQDGYRTIDWKNWTFCEQTSTTRSPDQHIKFNSFELRPKEFDLNELPTLSHPDVCVIDDEEPEQCGASQSEGLAEASPVVLIADQEEIRGYFGSLDGAASDCEVYEATDISHELQRIISCRESDDSSCQPRNSLWVDKYQPRSASEVCGNTESVNVMNEWLCLWRERGFQPSKDFLSSEEEKSQDADYNCSEIDSDSENICAEDYLKNVLLIVGPAGSGKSAAIHACAKEQGFKILESNTSECRSGTVVRQKFGEALKSYSLSRSLDPLFNSCTDGNGVEDVIEVAPVLHIQNDGDNLKPLILFEDVDICFAEDRGLVSAIQQIVGKAKGPVVLTANDKNHGLPDNLERIEICFSLPSKEELLSHLSLVCAAEEVKVNPGSLEQLTMFSGGDIRKAIMQLQFWFQSKPKRARKVKNTCNPDFFDHEAGHLLLPKIISRDFPSHLSQLVESEIAKVLSIKEESYNTVEVFVEEVENEKMLNKLWRRGTEKNSIQAKKAAMFRQNTCFEEDYDELEDVLSVPCGLSNTSYQPLAFSQPNRRRKLKVVMSSDSEDEPLRDIRVSISRHQKDDRLVVQENGTLSSYWPDMQKDPIPLADPSVPSRAETLEATCYQYETSKVNELSQSLDVSCVPESSYVPETIMDGDAELSPRAVSCGHFDGRVEVSMSEDGVQSPPSKEIYVDRFQIFDCLKNTCEIIAESSGTAVMEDCFKEYVGTSQKMQQISDECSRMDFGKTSKTAQKSKLDTSRFTVQESWKKLCSSHADFKPYLDLEPVEAPQVLDLTHQITNLISEADLTHSRCLNLATLEPMTNASGDLDTSDLSQMLEQMTSTVAQQGFSFFTNQIATTGSVLSSATMVPGRVLAVDEAWQDYTSSNGSCLDMKPEIHEDLLKCGQIVRLSGILESVVPLRSLKGGAFHEYASFIGQISRADPSNLSTAMEKSRRRRSREARQYLSMELSSEDTAFMGQHSTYSRNE